ncbi:sodium/proline symporter [Nesterenkonia sp. PF2B19]|uniref:sodium/proline symporter n=1 Tax=unclassified Nesterenkonia TaxID=2629769 RepID=UPI000873497E|nr:sodium/proline symporter [Nesterenkonia sp. PF2B19]OSM42607.1 sodium:proline symporter [Nesterenkonia sp. PF2B19]
MSVEIVFLVVYFLMLLAIGAWVSRISTRDREGYLLGGRSLGPAVTALRLQSTSMSGYMFLGAGGLGYSQGYFSMWYALGDLGGGVLNLSVLGRRMRKLSHLLGSITSIGYLEHRYPSAWTRAVAAPIALFCMFFYVLAQLLAGGQGLSMVTGLDLNVSLIIAVGVIVGYTLMGGYLAVAYTDFAQAIILVIGMLWILIATLQHVGGLTAGHEGIGAINQNLLTMWGAEGQYFGQWGIILGALLVFSIGYMGWPHVNVSHMSMRRPSVARRAGLYATGFNLLFIPGAYLVGMMALLIVPNLDDPEMAIFSVAETVLPSFAVGLVMAAIMAAIMSTADALLLQAGTIASQDLWGRFVQKNMSERSAVAVSRLTILILAVIGLVLAMTRPPGVFDVVVFATSVLGAAFVPAYVCAVWWKRANSAGAISSMIAGTVGAVAAEMLGSADGLGVDAMVVGILSSTVTIVVVSLATASVDPVPERVLRAVEETAKVGAVPARFVLGEDASLATQRPQQEGRERG